MKKSIIVLALIVLSLVAMPGLTAQADDEEGPTITVTGKVTNNLVPVNNANVQVTCRTTTLSTTSNSIGNYAVIFNSDKCKSGDTVTVNVASGNLSGSHSQTVQGTVCNTNIALIVNVAIPEYVTLTGIVAAVVGGGAYLRTRRRTLG